MGAGQSKKDKLTPIEEIKIQHQRFKQFTYHESSDQLEIKIDMQSEKDYQNWKNKLAKLNDFQQKETLLLPVKHQYVNKGLCGTAGTLKIFYENYPYLFQEEIENRIEMNKHFEQQELWYLLYSLAISSAEFGRNNSKVGDIRPYNIFINEEGQIKIANLFSWPYEKTNFDKTAFQKTITYLAPEEIRLIAKGNQDNTVNKTLAESFSIGLTALQAGLLFNARQLYSLSNSSIDLDLLNRKLSAWHNLEFTVDNNIHRRYSPLLRNIVAGLCISDERQRLSSVQVEQILRPYENQMLNLRQFDHRNVRLPARFEQRSENQYYQNNSPNRNTHVEYVRREGNQPNRSTQVVFPQQTVVVNRPPEIRGNPPAQIQYARPVNSYQPVQEYARPVSSSSPPRQYTRPVSSQQPVRFNTGQTVYIKEGQRVGGGSQYETRVQSIPINAHEQQFYRYAGPNNYQPPQKVQGSSNNAGYQQIFNQYATMNHNHEPREVNSNVNFRSTTYNTGNTMNYAQNRQYEAPVRVETTTTTSQFTRPYTSTNTQVVTTSMGGSNEGSDFLRKIDEQLEASRRQFPSR